MLCGGVPCQSWSIAGKRKGFEDIRGTMWYEVFRIAKVQKPKYLFLENVKGLLSHTTYLSKEFIHKVIQQAPMRTGGVETNYSNLIL